MENKDMLPEHSPEEGVVSVNKKPWIIFFGVAFIFFSALGFALYHMDDYKIGQANSEEKKKDSMSPDSMASEVLGGGRPTRNVVAKAADPVPPKEVAPKEVAPEAPKQAPVDPNIEHIKQLKRQQFEAALSAEPGIKMGNAKADKSAESVNPAQLAKAVKAENRWTLNAQVEAPESDYMIRAGAVIPGVMVSGINSDLPGQLIAQVANDVYDTASHKIKLIPQGTKLFGTYDAHVIYGQEAVMVSWQRLTFPDAKVLDIGEMPGADLAGYSGFRDDVDHHYFRIYGNALLMSAIVGGVALSQNQGNSGGGGIGYQQNSNTVLSQVLGQQLGQVTSQMIGKNMNIAPTIMIRPGFSFNVIATKDIVLPSEYRNFDYK